MIALALGGLLLAPVAAALPVVAGAQEPAVDSARRLNAEADSLVQLGTAAGLRRALELKVQVGALQRRTRDSVGEGVSITEVGALHHLLGRPDSSVWYFHLALPIQRANRDQAAETETLRRLGGAFSSLGRQDSALYYLDAALPLVRDAKNRAVEAEILNSIGLAHRLLDRYDSALVYYGAALGVAREVGSRGLMGTIHNNTGRVYWELRRSDSALANYHAAIAVHRETGDRRSEAATLQNIGNLYAGSGQVDSARTYLGKALPIRVEVGDRRGEGVTLSSLGSMYFEVAMWDSTLIFLESALKVHRETGARQEEARVLAKLGIVAERLGRLDTAMLHYRKALDLRRELRDRAGEAYELLNLGGLYRLGPGPDLGRSVALFDSSLAVFEAIAQTGGSELNRLNLTDYVMRRVIPDWTTTWLRRASELGARNANLGALAVVERGRAQGLLRLMGGGPAARTAGADYLAEGERAVAAIAGSGSAALIYQFTSFDTLLVWTVQPSGEVDVDHLAVQWDSVTVAIEAFRRGFSAGGQTLTARGQPLETVRGDDGAPRAPNGERWTDLSRRVANLILPDRVLKRLGGVAEVVVVPQASIALVPFAALVVDSSGTLFGAGRAVRYVPSLRTLAEAEARPRPSSVGGAMVVGDPLMPQVAAADGDRAALSPLPGSGREARAIAERLGTHPLTGAAATETAVRRTLASASVVHLATHGFAYSAETRARASFVALAPDPTHDGLLTVGEILDSDDVNLTADLVVLSACSTGLGDLRASEGTVGLQRALLAKGARSVLVSLWTVSDRATAELMERFYAHWLDGTDRPSKAEALRRAQEEVRRLPGYEHPRFWAAFQLVGAR